LLFTHLHLNMIACIPPCSSHTCSSTPGTHISSAQGCSPSESLLRGSQAHNSYRWLFNFRGNYLSLTALMAPTGIGTSPHRNLYTGCTKPRPVSHQHLVSVTVKHKKLFLLPFGMWFLFKRSTVYTLGVTLYRLYTETKSLFIHFYTDRGRQISKLFWKWKCILHWQ